MKIIVRPILDPHREIDLTHRLVSAIAEELWRLFGGNDTLNWIEAEWHLQRIIAQARSDAHETTVVRIAPTVSDRARRRLHPPARRQRPDLELVRPQHTANRRRREAHTVEGTQPRTAETSQVPDTTMANA
jgi:hypothetical protein